MNEVVRRIEDLKRDDIIRGLVSRRINEFESLGRKSDNGIFKELCFCLMTANCAARKCIDVQDDVGDGFFVLNEKQLQRRLKELGYRFHNRAPWFIEAREKFGDSIKKILKNFKTETEAREFLVKNVKGLGYKESSHFLRNIGYKDLAIIDFHIIDVLVSHGIINRPKTMSRKVYLETEEILRNIAKRTKISLAELDLYLWYMETGEVLK